MPDAISKPNTSSKPTPPRNESVQTRAPDPGWQQQLVQKDELIHALTEQLEQAAEQLDRFQRSGARGRTGASGAVPEEQRKACEDLQRIVQQWEDLQAGLTLGRIEMQVSEIRDLILDLRSDRPHSRNGHNGEASQHHHDDQSAILSFADLAKDEESPPANTEWERMKSQLLSSDDQEADAASPSWDALEQPLPEPPPAISPENSDATELHTAIVERDDYIRLLLTRLRRIEVLQPAAAISALEPDSSEFVAKVQLLEQRLLEHARCAEVELSVERAKLARERSQLAQQQEHISRQLKKLGLNNVDDLNNAEVQAGTLQERRWSRFLGRPRNE